ncbi:MAG: AAA family ATPase [Candidatus Lokiarchaeota archaeon]|nr:AAA family ATPase [Candidatus Lokiarchaeota archaeon]
MSSLRIAEAEQIDVGKCRVRIDPEIMDQMDLESGSIIELLGKKNTGAIALRGNTDDKGHKLIRMDGLIRSNIGAGVGDIVKIKKAQVKTALEVQLAPIRGRISANLIDEIGHSLERILFGRPLKTRDVISLVKDFSLNDKKYIVVKTRPTGIIKIEDTTELKILPVLPENIETDHFPEVSYEDIGGLNDRILRIREMIELPLRFPELFDRLGIQPPSGVLLHGPPGCGKTLLAKAVANESDSYFLSINGPEIMSKFYGESEKRIRQIFDDAEKNAPSIIFIDEIDSIAPKREQVSGEVERRVVAQLLALMDGLKYRNNVIVIAASNRPNAIDLALRRPGRFDREIEIGVPDRNGRLEVLQIHTRGMPLENVDLETFSKRTHGFVGADLASLCREAAMFALRRFRHKINMYDNKIPAETLLEITVNEDDFENALKIVEPSALREIMIELSSVTWNSVGGLEDVKAQLIEAVDLPLRKPEIFEKYGITPINGILLFGCPGTGKTLIAKAIANYTETNFIPIRGPEIFSKWVGESERAIREIFRKARQTSPSIIFIDEIDALAPERGQSSANKVTDTVVNQLLTEMSGLQDIKQVICIGATNRPDMIDKALLRPGRFDKLIYVPMPDFDARYKILEIYTKNMPLEADVEITELAKLTKGYSGADLQNLCREAVMMLLSENSQNDKVSKDNFNNALKVIKPTVTEETKNKFEEFADKYCDRKCYNE